MFLGKTFGGDTPGWDVFGVWNAPSLSLFPGLPDKAPFMGKIDLFEKMFKMILKYINTVALKILILQLIMKYLRDLKLFWTT